MIIIFFQTLFFPTMDPSADAQRSFASKEILVLSNSHRAQNLNSCEGGLFPCHISGCFSPEQRCDGKVDCKDDSSDEMDCGEEDDTERFRRQMKAYRLSRLVTKCLIKPIAPVADEPM